MAGWLRWGVATLGGAALLGLIVTNGIAASLSAGGDYTTATGKAKIVDKTTNAKLKVTFFWPFYGDYWILDLGDNYEYAVVGAPNRKYLWILSRSPQMDEGLYRSLLAKMAARGFKTEEMIKTTHQ